MSVTPDEYISTPGGRAVFTCSTPGVSVVDVQWLVNGTELGSLNLTNVTSILETSEGKCRVVSKPGQNGIVNAILLKE